MIKTKGIFIKIVFLLFMLILSAIETIAQTNNIPIAVYDVATVDQDTTLNVPSGAPDNYTNLLDNDTDSDGDTLSIVRFSVNGGASWTNAGSTINITEGSITINADGTYTFVPTAGYIGFVPNIIYEITDGTDTSITTLFLTVATSGDLIEISGLSSCNQGYTADGRYKIRYQVSIRNTSITRGYHQNSEITNIQLFNDLNAVFGDCVVEIERTSINVNAPEDFLGSTYPLPNLGFDDVEFHENDATPGAQGIFNTTTTILYPRQSIFVQFCVYIDPFCNGRPNPTPSGSGIDFDNIITVTSNKGNDTINLLLEDLHTPETTVAANLYIPEQSPLVNLDGTYDYSNTVIITNDGTAQANNVNFNMGLKRFLDNGITFTTGDHDNDTATPDVQTPYVFQVDASGDPISTITINNAYDGITSTTLLDVNQVLPVGETIFLKIFYHINSIISTENNQFFNPIVSMTQGALDGFDETIAPIFQNNSYVLWEDANGNHLDRYYTGDSINDIPSSNDQCDCDFLSMQFEFGLQLNINKTLENITTAPNNVLEHKLVSFRIRIGNETSSNVRVANINLIDNLLGICGGNILSIHNISIELPTGVDEIPEEVPNINTAYDGILNTNLFDGNSGILNPGEFLDVLLSVVISDDCLGTNTAEFYGLDPLNNSIATVVNGTNITIFSDSDNDGISNINDIDDDNDGVPDTVESNGFNPLDDADNDNIPNYIDTDFGADSNTDGIVDLFDFDMDGIPNHFDLDSDNDGIFDIVEAGNGALDTSNNGQTNTAVGVNGLDNSLENVDDASAVINYTIPNSDTDINPNYLDIDSDNDGIVDNIEAQLTDSYIPPNTPNINGIVYVNGLTPIDTDGDTIPDYLDTNTDNDLRDDLIEAWDTNDDEIADTIPANNDSDNDGLDDNFDTYDNLTATNNGILNASNNGQLPTDFPNENNASTPERDWRELPAILVIIDNISVVEGNDLVFTISLVSLNDNTILRTSAIDVVIDISTSDGTDITAIYDVAVSPYDYNGIDSVSPSSIIIPAGDSTIQIIITSIDDTINEITEFFTINGLLTSANTINPDTNLLEANVSFSGIGTIQDNDDYPDLIMNDDTQLEGDDLVHRTKTNPSLANPTTSSSRPIEVKIIVTDLTATSPDDYINTSPNTITISATNDPNNENTFVDYHIQTILDELNELDQETVSVIGTVINGFVGTVDLDKIGTIIDRQPDPRVLISNPTVVEGKTLEFVISLENPLTNEPLANFEDTNLNIFTNDGTAREPEDYLGASNQVVILAYTTSVLVQVQTNDDLLVEDTEDLTLKGVVTTFNTENIESEGLGTIIDNDFPNLFSPNNDGLSDVFEIVSLYQYLNFKIQIFDRWGSLVHDYGNHGNPQPVWWNGTIKGNPVPEGVYYYTIDYNDNITAPKSGFIQLIR